MFRCNDKTDTCAMTPCRYPNGVGLTIAAQFLLFCGFVLSAGSMTDCKFVVANTTITSGSLPDSLQLIADKIPTEGTRRGLGYFFFEDRSGSCFWDDTYSGDVYEWYKDQLGSDWHVGRGFGVTTVALSFCLWIWVLMASCTAHPRAVRSLIAALHVLILVPFQYVTFNVLKSDFCDDSDCDMNRSAWLSIVAGLCFLASGLLWCLMKNYPGEHAEENMFSEEVPQAMEEPRVLESRKDEEKLEWENDGAPSAAVY